MKVEKIKLIKLLWKLIAYKPWLYGANVVLWILVFAYNAVPSYLTREFLNNLSDKEGSDSYLIWLLALIIGVGLARIVVVYLAGLAFAVYEFLINALIRRNILESIFKKPGADPFKGSTGEALNSLKDDVEQANLALDALLDTIGTTVFSIIALGFLISINPVLTLFVFTPLVAVVVISKKATRRIQKYRKRSREITSEVSGMLGEIFGGVQAVKISGAEKNILGHLHSLNRKRHKYMLTDTLFTRLIWSIGDNMVNLGTGLVLLLVAQSMRAGSFKVGDFALFVYYLGFVADYTHRLGDLLAVLKQSETSFERMASLIDNSPEVLVEHKPIYLKDSIQEPEHVNLENKKSFEKLEVKGMEYIYPESANGIRDISFEVKKGSFTVITGRIGSGKTTLLKTLTGLLRMDSGSIAWNSNNIKRPDLFFIPPRVAYTAQVPHLFSDTVRNNILLGMKESEVDLEEAVASAVLERDILSLENGLDTLIGPMGVKLSGGQIQRVAAARMFARNTELLVFDDISSALDIETESILWERLSEREDSTCLVVSNKKAALQRADNIIVLKDGRIEAQGKLEELLQGCEEFKQIYITGSVSGREV